MAIKDYINRITDSKYVIKLHSDASNDFVTTFPSKSFSENVVTQSVTQSVFNNYSWTEATGTIPSEWNMLSGTDDIALLNPNRDSSTSIGYNQIGARTVIRGDEIFTSLHRQSSTEKHNGVAIFKSSSLGWQLNDYINIPSSSGGDTLSAVTLGREFSLYGNYLAAPAVDTNSVTGNSKLHLFKSGSGGWEIEQTLTTASYNAHADQTVDAGHNTFITAKLHGNRLVTTGFTYIYGSPQYKRYIGIFKSGSATGWELEDSVFIRDSGTPGGSSDAGGSVGLSSLSLDFDGTTIVVASKEGVGSQFYHNQAGAIYVITSGSDGWAKRQQLDLSAAGVTDDVSSNFGSNYSSEYRTFVRFGYYGCAVSGSYIVGAAEGSSIYVSSLSAYRRQRNAVFVFKSSSLGWGLEKRINDPSTDFVETAASSGDTTQTYFGLGVELKNNSLIINSPRWRSDTAENANNSEGRAYVYVTSSSTGWSLDQTIDSPFSGSSIYNSGSGDNEGFTSNAESSYSSGEPGYGVTIASSGSYLALGSPRFTRNADNTAVRGAVFVLSGAINLTDQVVEEYVTESVTSSTLVQRDGGTVPFRFSSKGAFNLRGQSANKHYKTFVGERKN